MSEAESTSEDNEPVISSSENARGSTVLVQHTERKMKLYGVFEEELKNLDSTSREGRFWVGAASFSAAWICGSLWDVIKDPKAALPENAKFCLWVFGAFFVFAVARACLLSVRREVILNGINPSRRTPIVYRFGKRIHRWLDRVLTGERP